MYRDRRLIFWLCAAAVCGIAIASVCARRSSIRTLPPPATPPLSAQPLRIVPQSPQPAPAVTRARHDADFWLQEPHLIALRYRTVTPAILAGNAAVKNFIVQFGGPLDDGDRQRLEDCGVHVFFATSANAFHVRTSEHALLKTAQNFAPKVLGWAPLLPSDKLLPALHERYAAWPEEPAAADAPEIAYRIEFFPDADPRALTDALTKEATLLKSGNGWLELAGPATRAFADRLAAEDDVYALDLARPKLKHCNLASANASNITPCQNAPLNLNGSGITVMVRDQGAPFNHPDFGTRLTLGPDVMAQSPVLHSTHVCGIIGGTGMADPSQNAQGMANACSFVAYDLNGDEAAEPLDALHTYGALLSNHSYGFETGWDSGVFTDDQATFGTYSSFAQNWDSIVRSEGLIMIKAAGNFRNQSGPGHPPNGVLASDFDFYTTVDASSTSKNVIVVGTSTAGVQAGSPSTATSVLSFSSSGPCTDGRLKPELIADGDSIVSCNTSAAPGNQYTTLSGTSMACAVVTGATALFLQHYQQKTGSIQCPPHYIRALYAETATDFGRPGPDFLHGFGMLDLNAAINLFDLDNNTNTRLVNSSITATVPERFFRFSSDGVTPIKVTLCWTDDFGDVLAQNALINDLDLRVVRASDQSVSFPFVLDKNQPAQSAKPGLNSVDTIEQVLIPAPFADNYLVAVRAPALARNTNFTLASSHALIEDMAPIAKIKASSTSGPAPLSVTFDGTGSSDPDGNIAQYLWSFGDGATATGPLAAHVYSNGSYTATLQVIDDQGATASTSILIGVNNIPPVANLNVTPASGVPPLSALFSSAGSVDPDGTIQNYTWSFGDGTGAFGPQVTHTYAAPGLYFIFLTVTDDGGATARSGTTLLAGNTMTAASARFGLNFQKLGADRFSLTSKNITVSKTLNPLNLGGSVRLGQAQYAFKLDAKGRFNAPPLSGVLTPSKSQFRLTIKNTNLGGAFAGTQATNRTAKAELVSIPFALYLDSGDVFGSTGIPFRYTSKQGKSGAGTAIKN
jgi:PKD repeat protein